MKKIKLRVSHFPQVPCKAFHVDVNSIEEAMKIKNILANYDLFQYNNRIKPDYCKMFGKLPDELSSKINIIFTEYMPSDRIFDEEGFAIHDEFVWD